jgi:ribosomal protein S13
LVQAWYQGGVSVMDFTDPEHPQEIAYFDRGPIDPKLLVSGGSWSAYWYNGNIYSSEIARGLDIFELTPSEHLSQNEIDAAKLVRFAELNVQNQQRIVWPRKLVVAKAYIDQLERSGSLSSEQVSSLRQAIQKAEASKNELKKLKGLASTVEKNAGQAKTAADSARLQALADILRRPEA